MLKIRRAIFLLLLVLGHGVMADPALLHRVEVFSSETTWESIESFLAPTSGGHHTMVKQRASFLRGNCEDLLQKFQSRPLDVMENNKYISAELKAQLLQLKMLGILPSQILMLNQYSELSESEAAQLFPDPAVLKARTLNPPKAGQLRRVSRGTMWAIRGFKIDMAAGRLRLQPLQVPWERGQLAQGLERTFDRARVPYLYEIGRTLAEEKPLPGDFKAMSAIMTQMISSEAEGLGLGSDEVIVSAHALDHKQARLFAILFPFRILNAQVMSLLEGDLKRALGQYLSVEPPRGEEWKSFDDTVSFASLAEFQKKFPSENISHLANLTAVASNGAVQGRNALYFWREYRSLYRKDYNFDHPQMGRSEKPLMVMRSPDALYYRDFFGALQRYGMPPFVVSDPRSVVLYQNIFSMLSQVDANHSPDLFLENWYGKNLFMLPDLNRSPGARRAPSRISHMITNLDPEMVKKFPRVYLAAVILGLRDSVQNELTSLSAAQFLIVKQKLDEDRLAMGLPRIAQLDAETYFSTYGIAVPTVDGAVAQDLAMLGGRKFHGDVKRFSGSAMQSGLLNGEEDYSFAMNETTADFFLFRSPELKRLLEMFPYLGDNARHALQPGQNKYRIRLFYAPTI